MTLKKCASKRPLKHYLVAALIPALMVVSGCTAASALKEREGSSAIAQTSTPESSTSQSATARAADTVNIPAFAKVLTAYVNDTGLVDYDRLQTNRQDLDAFNASVQLAQPGDYANWSEADQIAFLINAYNSLTLKSIIDESPIKSSIKDIRGVWQFKRHGILQDEKTLNNIEHDMLRANFTEPRIHAALVCAALSCPYLRQEPFTGDNLDAQLDDQVKIFLSRPEVLTIDKANNEVQLSEIFSWFGQDWIAGFGVEAGFAGNEKEKGLFRNSRGGH
ncbi:MAG: DUF547 domain-containing protein [Phormidesmis priestleyi]|uniref:DUF547 domain-containing protein n=1 Tax=Phormidesmis priestleyi TaxID=268141 RepID=A0A2W4WHV0_9CYAN|nr:MAG: DUF547 domain-containing protein [Phormidesmis priestleyi]